MTQVLWYMPRRYKMTNKDIVSSFNKNYTKESNNNKQEFTKVYDVLKIEDTREGNTKELLELGKSIKLDSAKREFNALVRNVLMYVEVNNLVNYGYVTYDNLKSMIKVAKYTKQHHEGDYSKISKIGNVWDKGMSAHRYNNELATCIIEVYESIKVEVTPHKVTIEESLVYIDTVGIGVKKAMLERLMSEFGYEVSEVA